MLIWKKLFSVTALLLALPLVVQAVPLKEVSLKAEVVQSGLDSPVFAISPTGDARLFVLEQSGQILILENGTKLATPFLDIASLIRSGGEQGLLGLAFHPDYANNGRFFVNYTDRNGDTRIVAYKVSANDPNVANPDSAQILLGIDQPYGNHNGGWLGFGPDGYLYIATGDGGGGGDPDDNAQNKNSLLGKILRIDVNSGSPYAIPAANPFAKGGGSPEIFVYGMRNPWRVAFDGDNMYLADVGQSELEEISVITPASAGANLGWPIMEGSECYRSDNCVTNGLTLPVYEYSHNDGCSLTGGFVYRGSAIPELAGHYFFADYCTGLVRSFVYANGSATEVMDWTAQFSNVGSITSFGVDSQGELYLTTSDGTLYKIVRAN